VSEEIKNILIKAKQNLIDFGVGGGSVVEPDGHVCALGAIYIAEGIIERVLDQNNNYWDYRVVGMNKEDWHNYPDTEAVQALAHATTFRTHGTSASAAVYRWNDRIVSHHPNAVIAGFDRAIEAQ